MKETGGPAHPTQRRIRDPDSFNPDHKITVLDGGLTKREYAAIHLLQPDSGLDWLDEMIRRAKRDELAAEAMQGLLERGWNADGGNALSVAHAAYVIASAMLERGREP